jgi:uncharacterized protein (TIGR02646 family)
MRPIDKGPCPQVNGSNKTVTEYAQWRNDLIERIGAYCVYCNMPITHSLQVEHVVPKVPQAGQPQGGLVDWNNVLLACGPCNRSKSNNPSDRQLHYLLEFHNTLIPFVAENNPNSPKELTFGVNSNLNDTQQKKAAKTIRLLKLDNVDNRDKIVDLRSKIRAKEYDRVCIARQTLELFKTNPNYNEEEAGKLVARYATGFFFLWFKEFENEPSVIKWLIHPEYFPGVAQNCFDPNNEYSLLPRNPNDNIDPI